MKSLVIIGKRYQDKNGNTYHSVIALVDGEKVINIPYRYGYENQYLETARIELIKVGYIDSARSLYHYCEENKINFYCDVTDVKSKKDL